MEKIMNFEQLLSNIDAWIENVYLRNHTKEEIFWNSYTAAFIVGFRDMLEGYLIPNEEYEEDDIFDANTNLVLRYFNDGNDLIDLADAVFGANDPDDPLGLNGYDKTYEAVIDAICWYFDAKNREE